MNEIIRSVLSVDGGIVLANTEAIMAQDESILSIDASTSKTGMAILRKSDAALYGTMFFKRDDLYHGKSKY